MRFKWSGQFFLMPLPLVFSKLVYSPIIWTLFLFTLFYLSFDITYSAHWRGEIELHLNSAEPTFARVKVKTPKGELEQFTFLSNNSPLSHGIHDVKIINTGYSNANALDNVVSIYQFNTDENNIPLGRFVSRGIAEHNDGYLKIEPNQQINYHGPLKNGYIYFSEPAFSPYTEVYIDNQFYAGMDLYSNQGAYSFKLPLGKHKPGRFLTKIELPVSEIDSVRLEFEKIPEGFSLITANLNVNGKSYPLNGTVNRYTKEVTFDNSIFDLNEKDHQVVALAKLITALALAILLVELVLLFRQKQLLSRSYLSFWLFFVFSLSAISLISLSAWPSIIQTDSMATWAQVKHLDFNSWHSHVYSFFILCLSLLYDSPGVLTVVQSILMALTISVFYYVVLTRGLSRIWVGLFFTLTLTSIPILIYPSFFVRDVIYSILTVFTFLLLFIWSLERRKEVNHRISTTIYLGILIAILCGFRSEGIYLVVAIPIFYFIFVNRKWGHTSALVLSCLAMLYTQGKPMKEYLNVHEDQNYILTLVIEPLGEIISQHHISDSYREERVIIEKIIRYDDLANHYKHLEAFWSGRQIKYGQFNNKDIDNLKKLTIKLVLMNPHIFIKNRARVFYDALLSITGDVNVLPAYHFTNSRRWGWDSFEDDKYRLAIFDSVPTNSTIIKYQYDVYAFVKKTLKLEGSFITSGRTLIWNAFFSLILTLFFVTQWFYFPKTAAISTIILMRMGMLFLFSPMSHFKYFFDIYMWGYFIVPMALFELSLRAQNKKTSKPLTYSPTV